MTSQEIEAKIRELEIERDQVAAEYQSQINVLMAAGNLVVRATNAHIDTLRLLLKNAAQAQAIIEAEAIKAIEAAETVVTPSSQNGGQPGQPPLVLQP